MPMKKERKCQRTERGKSGVKKREVSEMEMRALTNTHQTQRRTNRGKVVSHLARTRGKRGRGT